MKVIKGVNEKLDLFSLTEDGEQKDKASFKDMYRTVVSLSLGNSGDQALEMFELGLKLKNVKTEDIEIEDAEFKLLKDKVQENKLQQPAYFLGQLLKKLKDAENDAVKKS
jgi:hypothetical protein